MTAAVDTATTLSALGCVEAEAAVLGAAMVAPQLAGAILGDLNSGDFTDPRHRDVLDAIRALLGQDVAPDPVAVLGQLRRAGVLSSTTDRSAGTLLADLLAGCPVPAAADTYRRIVIEHSFRRAARETSERIAQAAETAPLARCQQVLDDGLRAAGAALARCQDGGQS